MAVEGFNRGEERGKECSYDVHSMSVAVEIPSSFTCSVFH